jgi:uncharacterized protein YqeY
MLRSDLQDALKTAMKAKDKTSVSTLRLILAALKDRDIAAREDGPTDGVTEPEILELLQKMVRQREEAIELYKRGGRPELAEREQAEIEVIGRFLPQPMDESEIRSAVADVMAELEVTSMKDMGRAMAELKQRYPGRMDFARASVLVRERLS